MSEQTENLQLVMPDKDEQYDVDVWNANSQKIDDFAGTTPPLATESYSLVNGAKINGVNFKGNADIVSGLGLYSDTITYNNTNLCYVYSEGDLFFYKSLQNSNIGHNPVTSPTYWEKLPIGEGASRNIGEYVTSSLPLTDNKLHLADGAILANADYPELLNRISTLYNSLPTGEFETPEYKSNLGAKNVWALTYDGSKFVALSNDAYISTSENGETWTQATQNSDLSSRSNWTVIAYGNGNYVAISGGGGNSYFSTSNNGTTWTTPVNMNIGLNNTWTDLKYDGTNFIALTLQGKVYSSSNLTSWTHEGDLTTNYGYLVGIIYTGTYYIALTISGYMAYSTTLSGLFTATFSKVTNFGSGNNWSRLIKDAKGYMFFSNSGYTSTSQDGINWTVAKENSNILSINNWTTLAYGDLKTVALSTGGYVSVMETPFTNSFTTEEKWQATYTQYGECGQYVYDSQNNTVRIPSIKSYFKNTTNFLELGEITPACVPNIKGTFGGAESVNDPTYNTGAFYGGAQNVTAGGSSSNDADETCFDASRCSSVYSNEATTVETQSVKQLVYIVVKK